MNADQRGGAGRVNRHAGSMQSQQKRNPPGGRIVRVAACGVDVQQVLAGVVDQLRVIMRADPDEDAGCAAGQFAGRVPRILQSLLGHFEQQALLRVHGGCLARRDAE